MLLWSLLGRCSLLQVSVFYKAAYLTLLEILEIYWNYFTSWKSSGNLQSLLEIFWFSL